MTYFVWLVLDDPSLSDALLDAWEAAGVRGVTILESSGIGRYRRKSLRDDMPLMPSLRNLLRGEETHHRTFFSLVEDEAQVERLAEVAQAVIGDFSLPHTGIFIALPVSHAYGLVKQRSAR
ncbi:MAG: hypothetical protein ABTQ73_06875 [Caldilineales bacterium]